MATTAPKFTLFTSNASQWAYVAHLALEAKGYKPDEYEARQIDLIDGENFDPEYVKINPNCTIPSLTSTTLSEPLTESADILAYLDSHRPGGISLLPTDVKERRKIDEIIQHVHQQKLSTNLILLQARDEEELNDKRAGMFRDFIANRQRRLLKYGAERPDISAYRTRTAENGYLFDLYHSGKIDPACEKFFRDSHQGYKDFAAGLDKLNDLLVLPYAAGDTVTAADLHVVPWLAHALWGAGGNDINDFTPLEKLIQKSVPEFQFGEKTMTWWKNISATEAFKKLYPTLH